MVTLIKNNKTLLFDVTIKFIFSIFFTLFAGWLSVHLSSSYYAAAPFHFDSASYLAYASRFSDVVNTQGRFAAFLQAIFIKDSFDLIIRILLLPAALKTTFGHMVVLLPFLSLFILLTIHYVFKRTQSWLASLLVISCLFSFPFMHTPYMGIADYWKESIAMWMLGAAVMSWLLSENLKKSPWSLLCGILLGFLVMQRSALAVYTAAMFFPLGLVAFYFRFKEDTKKIAIMKISALVVPAFLLSLIVILMQGEALYHYYAVAGYAYSPPFKVIRTLTTQIAHGFFLPVFVLMVIYTFCFYINSDWKSQRRDVLISLWLVISFPLVIIASRGLYHGFCNNWSILLIILLATVLPQFLSRKNIILYLTLLTIMTISSATQYFVAVTEAGVVIRKYISFRPYYDKLTDIMMEQPAPRYFALLYAEDEVRFLDHARLNKKVAYGELQPVSHIYAHDSYYLSESKTSEIDVKKIVMQKTQELESHENTLAVAYCDANQARVSPAYEGDGIKSSIPITIAQTNYLAQSPHWQAIKKIISPYGCVYVYRYTKTNLTDYTKWQAVT